MRGVSMRLACLLALLLGGAAANGAGVETSITIGTGGVTGVYYPTGAAICRIVNRHRKRHGVHCLVEASGGSVYNLEAIRAGSLNMGIVQSDWQFHAHKGTSRFAEAGPHEDLRSVFSLHPEPASLIAHKDSGIRHVVDLIGKRVNVGNPGSGGEATWNVMWGAMGKSRADLALAASLKSQETPAALCGGEIDALFWLVGHPNVLSKEVTTRCPSIFVVVGGPAIDRLVHDNPYYRYATIPGGMYPGNPKDVETFGVAATFVASSQVSADTVYAVTKAIFDDLKRFKRLHPALARLRREEMIADALSAPLHAGALRYYREKGWLP